MKLLVVSVIDIEPNELMRVADKIKETIKDLDEREFCRGLLNGKAFDVDFGDGVKSTYDIIQGVN